MPENPKTASSRLAYWQQFVSRETPFQSTADWTDETVWIPAARASLDLNSFSEKWSGPIRRAFEDFKLDARNPYHWRLLLTFYAGAHIRKGRPAEWDAESLCKLLRHISEVRKKRPNAKQSEIYQSLIKRNAPYAGKTESYLKHGHRLALNLDRNEILRLKRDLVAQGYLEVLRVSYEEKGWAVTASHERRIRNWVLDEALELIGAPNSRWVKK
jgi:hypothetical protein